MQQFGIAKENVLCLIVGNASNVTKMVESLSEYVPEADPDTLQDEDADEFENDCAMRVNIHHMRCAVHTLRLAIKDCLKQPHCDKLLTKIRHIVSKLRSPNVLSLLEKREKTPILNMTPSNACQNFENPLKNKFAFRRTSYFRCYMVKLRRYLLCTENALFCNRKFADRIFNAWNIFKKWSSLNRILQERETSEYIYTNTKFV